MLIGTKEGIKKVSGFEAKTVDTTGAGDSFWGGFLSRFLSTNKTFEDMLLKDWESCAVYGNATAALCVQGRGGIPAIPEREEVERKVNSVNY